MTNLDLAIAAWSAVRNSDDAPWEKLPLGIRAKLIDLAGKYRVGAKVAEGDYPPEGFAEKVWQLAAAPDVISGDQVVFLESRSPMEPRGLNHLLSGNRVLVGNTTEEELRAEQGGNFDAPEHEDIRIPSPNPEDVDPLKTEIEESSPTEVDDAEDTPKESELAAPKK